MKVALSKFSATTTTTIDLVEHLQILHCCVSFIEWFLNLKKNQPKKWNLGVSESLHHEKLIYHSRTLVLLKSNWLDPRTLYLWAKAFNTHNFWHEVFDLLKTNWLDPGTFNQFEGSQNICLTYHGHRVIPDLGWKQSKIVVIMGPNLRDTQFLT